MKNFKKSIYVSLFPILLLFFNFLISACNKNNNPIIPLSDNTSVKASSIQDEKPVKPEVTLDVPAIAYIGGTTITVSVPENFYGKLFIQESTDGGETWTTLAKTPDNDCENSFSATINFTVGTHTLRGHYAPGNCPGTKSDANSSEPINIIVYEGAD